MVWKAINHSAPFEPKDFPALEGRRSTADTMEVKENTPLLNCLFINGSDVAPL
jgi:hypothetical protein